MSRQMIETCFSLVKWNTRDPHNVVQGALHRIAVDTQLLTQLQDPKNGIRNHPEIRKYMHYAADRLAAEMVDRIERHGARQVPLSKAGALWVIERLRGTQPKAKIHKLRQIVDQIPWNELQHSGLKFVKKTGTQVFIKNEFYPVGNKAPRLICFPQEGEKLIMTMAFFHILHPFFSSRYATKELPEHRRPYVIEERLKNTERKFVADYTSFECCANRDIMRHGEHRVLRRLVAPEYHFVFPWIEAGGKLTHRSGVTIRTSAIQFSGRYTTSLSNSIRNKLFMDVVALDNGLRIDDYVGVYEGDDSLTGWPRQITQDRIERSLAKIGVAAEIAEYENVGEAGYCSTYWNANMELVYEPIKALARFPFTSSQLAASKANYAPLLAAKAMSMAYRAPGCPIVAAVVRRYISSTGYMETRNEWERRWFLQFAHTRAINKRSRVLNVCFDRWDLVREPTQTQRAFFEKIFGISVPNQIAAERHILEDDGFNPVLLACLEDGQQKAGVNLDELRCIYETMRSHARSF